MSTPPSVEQVRRLSAFKQTRVTEDFIDDNGHMNIGDYFRLCSHAVWSRLGDLGMGSDYIAQRGMSFFTVEHRISYLGELRLDQPFSVFSGVVERTAKAGHGVAYVVDDEHDRVACALEVVYVHVSMETRRAAPIPPDVAERLDAEIAAHADWLPAAAQGLTLRR